MTSPTPEAIEAMAKMIEAHVGENDPVTFAELMNRIPGFSAQGLPDPNGVLDGRGGGRHTPMWVFDAPTQHAQILQLAHKTCGMLTAAEFKQEGKIWDARTLIDVAGKKLPQAIETLTALSQMTDDEYLLAMKAVGVAIPKSEDELIAQQRQMHRELGLLDERE